MKVSNSQERLRELLRITNDKQADMVRKTGIEKSAISNYLNGKREPRQDKIIIIANAYNINPSWLMGLDVPMEIPKKSTQDTETLIANQFPEEDNETLHRLRLAMDMYERYKNAIPEIQEAVENLLKTSAPRS